MYPGTQSMGCRRGAEPQLRKVGSIGVTPDGEHVGAPRGGGREDLSLLTTCSHCGYPCPFGEMIISGAGPRSGFGARMTTHSADCIVLSGHILAVTVILEGL